MSAPLTPLEPWIAARIGGAAPLDRAALERWQLERLAATLRLARARSPFYRAHLAGAPERLASLDELARLPFTTAQALRDRPLQLLCVSQDAIQRIVTLDSSGTTGAPKRVAFTREDQELTLDFFHIGMATFTAPGDRVLIMLPGATPGSVGDLLATALSRLGAEGVLHDPLAAPGATAKAIAATGASVLVGTPTQALLLARHPAGAGVRLRAALLTSDHVPRAVVAAAEAAWGCVVYNHYGMTEMGLGGGVECAARRGYHLREADLLVEIVDPASGRRLPEGEPGEIVFTTLTRGGMPLVRYRTGDAGRFAPGRCPCGTSLKTLERVTHRLGGRVALAGAPLTMADLDEALFPVEGLVDFTATLTRAERDHLGLELRAVPGAADPCAAVHAALERIAPISRALALGQLSLSVRSSGEGGSAGPTLRKRTIADLRGEGASHQTLTG
ncbi:MAG: phenylacetate--CoA ligase family protein [Chloroflexales bacterium]|nr:phenylacetate--CoA ligase family protein [Chloroflexales bacterium]